MQETELFLFLQVENLLLDLEGKIKLCDFGSATTQTFQPNNNWSAQQRAMLEDQVLSQYTIMYRDNVMNQKDKKKT